MNQISFPAFAAAQAAPLCPPAGAVQTANDVPALVAQPDASGQRVDTLQVPLFALPARCMTGYQSAFFEMRPDFDYYADCASLDAPFSLPSGSVTFYEPPGLRGWLSQSVTRPGYFS